MLEEDSNGLSVAPDGRSAKDQPAWRRDFPLDWSEDEYRSRREFVAFLMLTSAAFVGCCTHRQKRPPTSRGIGQQKLI